MEENCNMFYNAIMERMPEGREKFTTTELVALRNDLIQGGMVDPSEAAELIQVFLMAKGYGVSQKAAASVARKVLQISREELGKELENIALEH